MTNAKHPGDETTRSAEHGHDDPDGLKQELFAAWMAEHPERTRQQFDAEWVMMTALTSATPPIEVTTRAPATWEEDPEVLKRRMFEEWRALRPDGTHAQFEAEWGAVTTLSGA